VGYEEPFIKAFALWKSQNQIPSRSSIKKFSWKISKSRTVAWQHPRPKDAKRTRAQDGERGALANLRKLYFSAAVFGWNTTLWLVFVKNKGMPIYPIKNWSWYQFCLFFAFLLPKKKRVATPCRSRGSRVLLPHMGLLECRFLWFFEGEGPGRLLPKPYQN